MKFFNCDMGLYTNRLRLTLLHLLFCIPFTVTYSQQCPSNIDFETGTFSGWTCWAGTVAAINSRNVISLTPLTAPVFGQHTIMTRNSGLDPYGGFPVTSPNGSGYSIKLGNDQGGGQAEGVSYEFTIPIDKDRYTLIYNYAVVFQDPNHFEYQQPRMEIEITNLSDNKVIDCSSFTFVPNGTLLPGFFISQNSDNSAPVWCKDWTSVSINLDDLAGQTIRLLFKTADCTFQRHFGYAYIDVNSECNGEFVGATFCKGDSAVSVVAPYGYQGYTWYNSDMSQVLGYHQTLVLTPPPPSGSTIAVKVEPYPGYGCVQTLYAQLNDTLRVTANANIDILSCNQNPVAIGMPPVPGIYYKWEPEEGLSDPKISNPFAKPLVTTTYYLTASNFGGGCVARDTVVVSSTVINNSIEIIGKSEYCFGSGDSAVLRVNKADSIQWYNNSNSIPGANGTTFKVPVSGNYHAVLFSKDGCTIATDIKNIIIEVAKPGIRYPVQYAVIDEPLTLQARTFGKTVVWNPEIYLDNHKSVTPVFKGSTEQLYNIEITTISGCVTVDTLQVLAVKNAEIQVPGAFTPNNDGKNDLLRPTLMGIKELKYFRVYNRWGELLYQTKNEGAGWNGLFKGLPFSPGVVVWIAEGVGIDGKVHQRKGTTLLIR